MFVAVVERAAEIRILGTKVRRNADGRRINALVGGSLRQINRGPSETRVPVE